MKLTPHFEQSDLMCKCGCGTLPNGGVAQLRLTAEFLEQISAYLGNHPISVNSGYRCPKHNRAVGGEPNSFHMRGFAADITVAGLTPAQVQAKLEQADSPVAHSGLGHYAKFTHVDRRQGRARWRG